MSRFAAPWALALLPVAIVAAWWMARGKTRRVARLRLPGVAELTPIAGSAWVRVDRALPWVRGGVLVLLVLALARPQSGTRLETENTEGVDIVVALDISGSMRCEDFRPLNRLAVAKKTVEEFADGRPADRIGLVVFSAIATTRCPLTLDHAMLRSFLDDVDFTPQEEDGTAIGLGVATAVNRLRTSPARSKVIVLVTDGRNNRGQVGPEAAAEAAKALGVRVYTVGVGTEGEAPYPVYDGPLGKRYVMLREDLDEALLKKVALATGGAYFRAADPQALREVFAKIDSLEKTRIESRVRVLYTELFPLALLPAGLMFLGEALLLATRLRRIP
jgi:Ca-activated chloride channel family protein